MYTINDVLQLARAGFSRAEISKMLNMENPSHDKETNPAPAPAPATAPAPAPATAPAPAPAPDPANDVTKYIAAVGGKLDALAAMLQNSAILGSQQPAQETSDDIIAQIINPKGSDN